jgi:hypothetical protein
MKLAYRGIVYTSTPFNSELSALEVTGKYRGDTVSFNVPMGVAQPRSVTRLSYRGVPYIKIR